jgi:hypothetical protein
MELLSILINNVGYLNGLSALCNTIAIFLLLKVIIVVLQTSLIGYHGDSFTYRIVFLVSTSTITIVPLIVTLPAKIQTVF